MGSDSEVVHHPVKDALLFPQYLIDFDSNFIWEDVAFVREGITFAMKAAVTWDKILLDDAKNLLQKRLETFHLDINHDKEVETVPGQKWTFLGFEFDGKDIDVCEVSVQKLKAKMRRKARALRRWAEVNGKEGWMAARAFVKHFNKKLYTCDDRSEINWSLWYFPLITTDKSLKVIDHYMQDCIRYIATGSRTKSRFDFRYEQIKELGLITLVNEWYSYNTKPGEHSVC